MKKAKPRIKKVFEKVVENGGTGIGKAMIEEGYSPNTAKTPQKVTESKSWEMLMDEYIPESLIAETHREAFTATRVISAMNTGKQATSTTADFIDVPDWQTRMKATELGYKIRGKLTDKIDHTTNGEKINNVIILPERELNDKRMDTALGTAD